jgi:hypothetical protein
MVAAGEDRNSRLAPNRSRSLMGVNRSLIGCMSSSDARGRSPRIPEIQKAFRLKRTTA